MNYINASFHRWNCASGTRKEYLHRCGNGILLQDLNRLYLRILNTVAYRDPENGSLAIGKGQVYMLHKCLWGKFKIHFLFNRCIYDQFRSASFDFQRLKLWILFAGHTSMAYDKLQWKIDNWLIKSTWHSLLSPQRPSTIICPSGKQASLGTRQSLVQAVEHYVSALQETVFTW